MILTDLFESQEIHNQDRLDNVLGRCIELIHEKHHSNPNKYGKVAACIIDAKNRKVFGINSPGPNGTRRHAERMAIDKYHERYGKIPPGAIIVTTLSPCNRDMAERDGPSCQDLLLQNGIEKVYSGYMDPSQHSDHPFTEEMTQNDDLWRRCKEFSDSFVHDDLSEDLDRPQAAGCILYAQDTGRYGLQQRSDTVNDPGVWAAWGGGREPGETLEQCATRELAEESGYTGPLKLKRLAENNKYTTFIGVVPHEFEPRACSEWKDYCWVDAGDWPGPMHPGVAEALQHISVNEAFNQPYKTKSEKSEYGDIDMLAKLPDGTNLSIMFNNEGDGEYQVEFYRNNSQAVTGEGDAQRIFATVLNAIQKFIKKYKPWRLKFSASKDTEHEQNSESRAKLYNRLVQRYAVALGYDSYSEDHGDQITYELTQLKSAVNETINPDILNRRFRHTQTIGDYTYKASVEIFLDEPLLNIKAYDGAKEIGHVMFEIFHWDDAPTKSHIESGGTEVEPAYQNKGVASTMYAYAKMLGNDIRASSNRTDQGKTMWSAWEKSGGAKHLTGQVAENFADGKNPQDKGDSKRYGVPTKASVSTLRKVAKQGGRKGQLAHWMANMKAGRAKAKK